MKPTKTKAAAKAATRIISTADRLIQRVPYGDISSAHAAAMSELRLGNLKNAWALMQESLGQAIRLMWVSQPGRANSGVTDRAQLVEKLRCVGRIDKWTYGLLKQTLTHPKGHDILRLELLTGIVGVMVAETSGLRPSADPSKSARKKLRKREQAACAIAEGPPIAEDRDPRQVEQWIPVPVAQPEPEPSEVETEVSEPTDVADEDTATEDQPALRSNREPRHLPTEGEIERECGRLRDHWSEHERLSRYLAARSVGPIEGLVAARGWTAPEVSLAGVQ